MKFEHGLAIFTLSIRAFLRADLKTFCAFFGKSADTFPVRKKQHNFTSSIGFHKIFAKSGHVFTNLTDIPEIAIINVNCCAYFLYNLQYVPVENSGAQKNDEISCFRHVPEQKEGWKNFGKCEMAQENRCDLAGGAPVRHHSAAACRRRTGIRHRTRHCRCSCS